MKKIIFALLAFVTLGLVLSPKVHADASQENIYRLYNKNTGEHFYTASAFERDQTVAKGWSYEGVGWITPKQSNSPIYRVFSPQSKGGDHYYTKSKYEASQLVKKGWKWDNNAKPVFYSGGNIPVYVAFNPNAKSGSHNYTINNNEQRSLISGGWKYPSVAWMSQAWIKTPSWRAGVQRYYTIGGQNNTIFGDNVMVQSDVAKMGAMTIALDADLTLTGSGRGYHGKLMIGDNNGSNVSFGIQYDSQSGLDDGQFAGKGLYLSENVSGGGVHAGGNALYVAYGEAPLAKKVHLRLAYYADTQMVAFFANGKLMGSQKVHFQPKPQVGGFLTQNRSTYNGATNAMYMVSAQGAAALNGDVIQAQFNNLVETGLPEGYNYWEHGSTGSLNWWNITAKNYVARFGERDGYVDVISSADVLVSGVSSLPSGYDWDKFPGAQQPTGGVQMPVGVPTF